MPEWSVIQPQTPEHWEHYYKLRFEQLRMPWGQKPGSERAEDDDTSLHGMIIDQAGKALAVGRIHQTQPGEAQIRFMAVSPEVQRKGLGKALLRFIEHLGTRKYAGLNRIVLQARENALEFYQANQYEVKEKTFVLFGSIQHYLMEKKLRPD